MARVLALKVRELVELIASHVERYVVGYRENVEFMVLTLLVGGHLLLYGPPGSAKTFTAKLFAQLLGLKFSRIQFTPDILPSDIVGAKIVDPKTGELRTVLGPIYANVVLADEINRGNPKSLSALLEAMQEKQISIEGEVYKLPRPFIVIATLNPVETHGIYPLPIAILDRFTVSLVFGYMDLDREIDIVYRDIEYDLENLELKPVADADSLDEAYREIRNVTVDRDLVRYSVEIVQSIRKRRDVLFGPSPRASIHMVRLARALAASKGRDYVVPDDIKRCAIPTLRHRVIPRGSGGDLMKCLERAEEIVREVLQSVEPPW